MSLGQALSERNRAASHHGITIGGFIRRRPPAQAGMTMFVCLTEYHERQALPFVSWTTIPTLSLTRSVASCFRYFERETQVLVGLLEHCGLKASPVLEFRLFFLSHPHSNPSDRMVTSAQSITPTKTSAPPQSARPPETLAHGPHPQTPLPARPISGTCCQMSF